MSVSLYGSGQTVLQVVTATSTTVATTSSNSYTSTGFSATITPLSSNSKILVLSQISAQTGSTTGSGIGFAIYRNGSSVWLPAVADTSGPYGAGYAVASNNIRTMSLLTYLDSPATTSATTYAIYFAARSTTATFNPSDNVNNGSSSIILLEISGS